MSDETPTEDQKTLFRLGAMYASACLELADIKTAAEATIHAIVPHPKYQHKTRLVWSAELELLAEALDKSVLPHNAATTDLLKGNGLPTYEEAVEIVNLIRLIRTLNQPDAQSILAQLKKLSADAVAERALARVMGANGAEAA